MLVSHTRPQSFIPTRFITNSEPKAKLRANNVTHNFVFTHLQCGPLPRHERNHTANDVQEATCDLSSVQQILSRSWQSLTCGCLPGTFMRTTVLCKGVYCHWSSTLFCPHRFQQNSAKIGPATVGSNLHI